MGEGEQNPTGVEDALIRVVEVEEEEEGKHSVPWMTMMILTWILDQVAPSNLLLKAEDEALLQVEGMGTVEEGEEAAPEKAPGRARKSGIRVDLTISSCPYRRYI